MPETTGEKSGERSPLAISRLSHAHKKSIFIGSARIFSFLRDFCICVVNLGFWSAFTIFIATRHHSRPKTIWLKCFNKFFSFRGKADKGVMSHFFTRGYRIVENSRHQVRTILDGGANIGDETIRFRHFHPQATIIAIEAEPNNFRLLKKNFSSDPKTICLNRGLWPVSGHLKIKPGSSNESYSVTEVPLDATDFDIDAISIADIVEQYGLASIDILKLDIEGAEFDLFTRNFKDISGLINVLIMECPDHERKGTVSALINSLDYEEFDWHIHGENLVLIRRTIGFSLESVLYY